MPAVLSWMQKKHTCVQVNISTVSIIGMCSDIQTCVPPRHFTSAISTNAVIHVPSKGGQGLS